MRHTLETRYTVEVYPREDVPTDVHQLARFGTDGAAAWRFYRSMVKEKREAYLREREWIVRDDGTEEELGR